MVAAAEERRPAVSTGHEDNASQQQQQQQEQSVPANASSTVESSSPIDRAGSISAKEKRWNTENLMERFAVDAACALASGGLVAPLISILDKAIIENASGRRPMMTSVKASLSTLLLSPHRFLLSRPFRLIMMLYGGTYTTANALDTIKSTTGNKRASTTSSGPAKFLATSTTNLSLCLYKDSQFTKMFGTVSARPVPGPSYVLFAARDCLTIFASFNLPTIVAPMLPLSTAMEKNVSRLSVAQFLTPAAMQLVSTPLHLLGLDLYNRNGGTPMSERLRKVRVDYFKSSLARMCRIVPAFGVGGVVNTGMRARLMKGLE